MSKIVTWDGDKARQELSKRLTHCKSSKSPLESIWKSSEATVYNIPGQTTSSGSISQLFESDGYIRDDVDSSGPDIGVQYAFKNLRFIHAQMSANPPAAVMRPTSNDQEDRAKADAADRLVRYALRQYRLQERIDRSSLNCLVYGTGIMKVRWNPHTGDLLEVDEETGEFTLEGDIEFTTPAPRNIYIDPDAQTVEDIRYVFERIYMPMEEALHLFGEDKKELLEKSRAESPEVTGGGSGTNSQGRTDQRYDSVAVLEYWEKGLPVNGYQGRFCYCTLDGIVLSEEGVGPNPHRFVSAGAVTAVEMNENLSEEQREKMLARLPKKAALPYHFFTDIDVPDSVWGKSFLEYVSVLQSTINNLDSSILDNVQAHGVARMVLPEGAEIADKSVTNSPWDIIKMTGSQPPHFVSTPSIMPEVDQLRAQLERGINDMSGVNEAMFGQQSRETSGFSMQYATNQGNMIRRRLFNKYAIFVEEIYRTFLNLVRKHWEIPRTIAVLGKEKALESVEIQGMDIDGGYDVVAEYGQSLSLDPMTRRDEIMALQPLFEKAGIPARISLQMMKLNELEGMYDMLELARDRQMEIFTEMIETGRYIAPEEFQDHENMMAAALTYFMTVEFRDLAPETKELLRQHIRDRSAMAAGEAGGLGGGAAVDGSGLPPGPQPGLAEELPTEALPPPPALA